MKRPFTVLMVLVAGLSLVSWHCDSTHEETATKSSVVSTTGSQHNDLRSSNSAGNRIPIELLVLYDLSGSQSEEKEFNRYVLVSLAENVYLRDIFRVMPVDLSSEGHNEMLIDERMPDEAGLMEMDLVAARNRVKDFSEGIDTLACRRFEFTRATSIIGALNTPEVLEPRSGYRRFLVLVTDGEESSWEVSLYHDFEPSEVIATLKQEGRIPDLSEREVYMAGPSSERVHERQLRKIRAFWQLFFQETKAKSFRWYGWDRRLLASHLNAILLEGQPSN
jgi:hypothetical protein